MKLIDADALRESVLKWLPHDPCGVEENEYPYETDICVSMLMEIEDAPTIEPEPHWIPCSERLPNYRDVVLVSTYWGVRVAERDSVKEDGTDDFWYLFLNDATARPMYVYAWMPLPKPWKGDK